VTHARSVGSLGPEVRRALLLLLALACLLAVYTPAL
jgi:hypothetical protein